MLNQFDVKTVSQMMNIDIKETEEYLSELNNNNVVYDKENKKCESKQAEKED